MPNYQFIDKLFEKYISEVKENTSEISEIYNKNKEKISGIIESFFEFAHKKSNIKISIEEDLFLQIHKELIYDFWHIVFENETKLTNDSLIKKLSLIANTQSLYFKHLAIHKKIFEYEKNNWDYLRIYNDLNFERTTKQIVLNFYRRFSLDYKKGKDLTREELLFIINYVINNNLKNARKISDNKILEQIKLTFNLDIKRPTYERYCDERNIEFKSFRK